MLTLAMLFQVRGQQFQCMHLWRGHEEMPVPCSIHWGGDGCLISLLFAKRNVVVSFLTPLSWDPPGFILFGFCSTICFCALFTGSQLLSFSVLFVPARNGFTRAMQACAPVGTADLISMICLKICDLQYHPASAILHTNFIPGSS